ncbi:TetR/AcrR family transcriptional regulator [Elioraea rosea]|uniref:TetR/AcrR family transcriptional regulator n=1 Tax=Elioraea rosea TaxID=2492390 RepID=UPI001182A0F8|nr:TetR/AcrR family transcriptional regulator [Elioraea rosea]
MERQAGAPDGERGPFSYQDDLAARLAAAASQPKTAQTRLRLMGAVAAALEAEGLHGLRVADCVARAGLAHGTFYRYWVDGSSAAEAVLSDFMQRVSARRPAPAPRLALHQRIVAANRYYVRVYRLNAGLMRCLMQLGNVDPAFARIGQAANVALAQRVVRAWLRADPRAAAIAPAERTARALACIAMVEGVLRDRHVRAPLEPLASMDDDAVADLLSDGWYRMLFGRPPPRRRRVTPAREMSAGGM